MNKLLIVLSLVLSCSGCFSNKDFDNASKEIAANFNEAELKIIIDFIYKVDSFIVHDDTNLAEKYDSLIYWLNETSISYEFDVPFNGNTLYDFRDHFNSLVDATLFDVFWNANISRSKIMDSIYSYKVWDIKRNTNYTTFIDEWSKKETIFTSYLNRLNESGTIPPSPDDMLPFIELDLNNINNRLIFIIHCITYLNNLPAREGL